MTDKEKKYQDTLDKLKVLKESLEKEELKNWERTKKEQPESESELSEKK